MRRLRPEGMSKREWDKIYQKNKRDRLKGVQTSSTFTERVQPEFTVFHPPSPELTADEILAHKELIFDRKAAYEKARKLSHVKINTDGPYGILALGDLHICDDGTDVRAIKRDVALIKNTSNLFCGHVGDVTNSWIGKLSHLWGQQSTTAKQSWILAQWFFEQIGKKLIFLTKGNHDSWQGAGDPLDWIVGSDTAVEPYDIRLSFDSPNGKAVTLNAKHNHKGHSIWNKAHGQMSFAMRGISDNIVLSGHKHTSGYGLVVDQESNRISHCIQLAAYEIFSNFQRSGDFSPHFISPSAIIIIDPDATSEPGLIQVFHDTTMGAEFLTYLRQKRGFK